MEIESMFSESYTYTKECLVGKWVKWILLIVCSIIFPLIYGYTVRILRGTTPAPELEDWVGLFIDGIKLLIIGFVYMIPVMLALILTAGIGMLGYMGLGGGSFTNIGISGLGIAGLGISAIIALIMSLIAVIGGVRFARTGSMGEAFNFSAILDTIESIGWGDYILALIILYIAIFIVIFIIGIIPIIGWIINILITPAITVFHARYISLLYDIQEFSA